MTYQTNDSDLRKQLYRITQHRIDESRRHGIKSKLPVQFYGGILYNMMPKRYHYRKEGIHVGSGYAKDRREDLNLSWGKEPLIYHSKTRTVAASGCRKCHRRKMGRGGNLRSQHPIQVIGGRRRRKCGGRYIYGGRYLPMNILKNLTKSGSDKLFKRRIH